MEDFIKKKVKSIKKIRSHSDVFVVTLNPEYQFDSNVAPQKMSFESKDMAMNMIFQAKEIVV